MNDMILTHDSEVLMKAMKDLDTMIERTIGNMANRNAEDVVMTMKLAIHLEKKSVPDIGGIREITQPSFKHDISSVMQVKDKMSGAFKGNVELTFDEQGRPVVRDVNDGQVSIFTDAGDVVVDYESAVDADVQSMLAGTSMKGLPSAATADSESDSDEMPVEISPYDLLMKYRNQDLEIVQQAEHFIIVATNSKEELAGTNRSEDDPLCVKPWKLQKHVGHTLVCITAPENGSDDEIEAVEIWCDDDGEMILSIPKPADNSGSQNDDEDYSYDQPEAG